MVRPDDVIKSQLVLVAWRYSNMYQLGGHLGAELIMGCLAERQRRGWGNWFEIIERIPVFAAEYEVPTGFPQIWEPSFMRLLHSVEGIYDGSLNPSKNALYWCDLRRVETPFFKEKILNNLEQHPKLCDMNSFSCFG